MRTWDWQRMALAGAAATSALAAAAAVDAQPKIPVVASYTTLNGYITIGSRQSQFEDPSKALRPISVEPGRRIRIPREDIPGDLFAKSENASLVFEFRAQVDEEDRLKECEVISVVLLTGDPLTDQGSVPERIREAACRLVFRHGRLIHGLSREGRRFGGTVTGEISLRKQTHRPPVVVAPPAVVPAPPPPRPPGPPRIEVTRVPPSPPPPVVLVPPPVVVAPPPASQPVGRSGEAKVPRPVVRSPAPPSPPPSVAIPPLPLPPTRPPPGDHPSGWPKSFVPRQLLFPSTNWREYLLDTKRLPKVARVGLELTIRIQTVYRCSVAVSSGDARLDAASCAALTLRSAISSAYSPEIFNHPVRVVWRKDKAHIEVPGYDQPPGLEAAVPISPAAAIAAADGQKPRVQVEVAVDTTGAPSDCEIKQFSYNDSADLAACDLVRSSVRFQPGRDVFGELAAAQARVVVDWEAMRIEMAPGPW